MRIAKTCATRPWKTDKVLESHVAKPLRSIVPVRQSDFPHFIEHAGMPRSVLPAVQNRHFKPVKTSPKNSDSFWSSCYRRHITFIADGCGRLWTSADSCHRLAAVAISSNGCQRQSNVEPTPEPFATQWRKAPQQCPHVLPTLLYLAIEGSQGMTLQDSPPDKMPFVSFHAWHHDLETQELDLETLHKAKTKLWEVETERFDLSTNCLRAAA